MITPAQIQQLKGLIEDLIKPDASISKLGLQDRITPVKLLAHASWGIQKVGRLVTKIEMLNTFVARELRLIPEAYEKVRVILSFQDDVKEVYCYGKASDENFEEYSTRCYELYTLMVAMGARLEFIFCKYDEPNRISWRDTNWTIFRQFNPPKVLSFYSTIYPIISHEINSEIKADPLLEKQAKAGVHLFSFGCGVGDEIKTICSSLPNEYAPKKITGIDISPINIETCKATIKTPQSSFFVDDVKAIEKYCPDNLNPEFLSIAVFSGILTTGVIANTSVATHVLQNALRANALCVVTGIENPLINNWIAKAIGFSSRCQNISGNGSAEITASDAHLLYVLKPMTNKQRIRYLHKRSLKRSSDGEFTTLDLSISARPVIELGFCIDAFDCEKIKSVDLSWSLIKENEHNGLIEKLKQLPTLKQILLHESQKATIQLLNKHYDIVLRQDGWHRESLPCFSPQKNKLLGTFKSLPHERKLKI